MLSSYFSLVFFFPLTMGEVSLRVVAFVRLDGRLAQFASALAGCVTVTLVSVGTSDDE